MKFAGSDEETRCLDELLVQSVGRLPRPRADVFEDVRAEFGTVNERRLTRRLAALCAGGAIVRKADGYVRGKASAESCWRPAGWLARPIEQRYRGVERRAP